MEWIRLKQAGAKWWHSDDYHSPSLTQASLGRIIYHILLAGGQIGEVWPFSNRRYSAVYLTVFMTEEQKKEVEENTAIRFREPPKITLNGESS